MSHPGYPDDAICAVETCGHLNREHHHNCGGCLTNRERGFTVEDPSHEFKPLFRGGRIATPGSDQSDYQKVMRGESLTANSPTVLPEGGLFG